MAPKVEPIIKLPIGIKLAYCSDPLSSINNMTTILTKRCPIEQIRTPVVLKMLFDLSSILPFCSNLKHRREMTKAIRSGIIAQNLKNGQVKFISEVKAVKLNFVFKPRTTM